MSSELTGQAIPGRIRERNVMANWKHAQSQGGERGMELYEKVKGIIVEQLGVDDEKVTPEARFREDLEADSLDLVELIMAFEDEFGGEISDDEAQQFKTVGQVVEYVQMRMDAGE
jgi:acyl carrier protein